MLPGMAGVLARRFTGMELPEWQVVVDNSAFARLL